MSDVNDNAPVFDHLPEICVSITEFHEIGDTVTLLKVSDADDHTTPNGKIIFNIEDGNELGMYICMRFIGYILFVIFQMLLSH